MKFVMVQWHDAVHPEGDWTMKADVKRDRDLLVHSCGFLVTDSPRVVQVAVSVTGHGTDEEAYTGIMTIPRGCIVSIREVAAGKAIKL